MSTLATQVEVTRPQVLSGLLSGSRWPALGAALLGIVLLYGAALAPGDSLHNAAHDTRHAFAFPCH